MNRQNTFKFNFIKKNDEFDFYVNSTNIRAYDGIINNISNNIILSGPNKSGKTLLGKIWFKKFNSIKYDDNFDSLIKFKRNILIDDFNKTINEEQLFHIINHVNLNNLKLLLITNKELIDINFKLNDLISRLKVFTFLKINRPDDDMLLKILTKLLIEKQFVIKSIDVFSYILRRSHRTYDDIFKIIEKIDNLSLEKKKQLTIPLIKEIL